MVGIYATVPVACFRKGLAREYLETEPVPPPATCYGFLLSLVGETDRTRHVGARVAPMLLGEPDRSVVLRTLWRVKTATLGAPGNSRPDYQQLLTGVELIVWLDSTEESSATPRLEERVIRALNPDTRGEVSRFGGLSLGESTHLVDEVALLTETRKARLAERGVRPLVYLKAEQGLLGLPVWVDHVGSSGTVYVTGELAEATEVGPPEPGRMPAITPRSPSVGVN